MQKEVKMTLEKNKSIFVTEKPAPSSHPSLRKRCVEHLPPHPISRKTLNTESQFVPGMLVYVQFYFFFLIEFENDYFLLNVLKSCITLH